MDRDGFGYDTPQYHLIRAMDYTSEASEKAAEALNSLVDSLKYGSAEYDFGDLLEGAQDALVESMRKSFSVMTYLSTVFAESVAAEQKKGEADGNEEKND